MSSEQRTPGDPIRVEVTKWGGRQHWRYRGLWLGRDEHGEWLGFPQGTHNYRPGFAFDSEVDCVTLVPDAYWIATFHAPGIWCDLYVDVGTPATWEGDVLRTVDLDLDVIRMAPQPPVDSLRAPQNLSAGWGEVFIDDEDEFAEHQVELGYPPEEVEAARSAADQVLASALAGTAPYDGSHVVWLERLAALRA